MSQRARTAGVTWLRICCGQCHRTLGRLRWPTNPPKWFSESDMDVHDWLYRYHDLRNTGLRGPIRCAGIPRASIERPTSETARLDTSCPCGHRGRLRLVSIPRHLTGDTITVP